MQGSLNDAQNQLLAQLNSNGLVKQAQVPGLGSMKLEDFTPSNGVPGHNPSSALQLAQKQQWIAQLVSWLCLSLILRHISILLEWINFVATRDTCVLMQLPVYNAASVDGHLGSGVFHSYLMAPRYLLRSVSCVRAIWNGPIVMFAKCSMSNAVLFDPNRLL